MQPKTSSCDVKQRKRQDSVQSSWSKPKLLEHRLGRGGKVYCLLSGSSPNHHQRQMTADKERYPNVYEWKRLSGSVAPPSTTMRSGSFIAGQGLATTLSFLILTLNYIHAVPCEQKYGKYYLSSDPSPTTSLFPLFSPTPICFSKAGSRGSIAQGLWSQASHVAIQNGFIFFAPLDWNGHSSRMIDLRRRRARRRFQINELESAIMFTQPTRLLFSFFDASSKPNRWEGIRATDETNDWQSQ